MLFMRHICQTNLNQTCTFYLQFSSVFFFLTLEKPVSQWNKQNIYLYLNLSSYVVSSGHFLYLHFCLRIRFVYFFHLCVSLIYAQTFCDILKFNQFVLNHNDAYKDQGVYLHGSKLKSKFQTGYRLTLCLEVTKHEAKNNHTM